MKEIGVGKVATISGRYYAMDRDNRWDRVEKAYRALTKGEGNTGTDPVAIIQASYDEGVNDEFVVPSVVLEDGKPVATIQSGDSVIFYTLDRVLARELTHVFCDDEFTGFDRGERVKTTLCMLY